MSTKLLSETICRKGPHGEMLCCIDSVLFGG